MPGGVAKGWLGVGRQRVRGRGGRLPDEGCRTHATELEPGRILKATLRAATVKGSGTLPAKLHAIRIVKPTARAAHSHLPLAVGEDNARSNSGVTSRRNAWLAVCI